MEFLRNTEKPAKFRSRLEQARKSLDIGLERRRDLETRGMDALSPPDRREGESGLRTALDLNRNNIVSDKANIAALERLLAETPPPKPKKVCHAKPSKTVGQ